MARNNSDWAGTVLGEKWQIGQPIGRGRSATVYAARHVRNGYPAAIKMIGERAATSMSGRSRYIVNNVHHGGVVRVIDDGVLPNGAAYIVMERLRGETLRAQLARGVRFSTSRAIEIAGEVLGILEAAHTRGIAHRNVSIDKVFLTTDGRVRLIGFGGAAAHNPLARINGDMWGTSELTLASRGVTRPDSQRTRVTVSSIDIDLHAVAGIVRALVGHGAVPPALVRVLERATAGQAKECFADAESMRTALESVAVTLSDHSAWDANTRPLDTLRLLRVSKRANTASSAPQMSQPTPRAPTLHTASSSSMDCVRLAPPPARRAAFWYVLAASLFGAAMTVLVTTLQLGG